MRRAASASRTTPAACCAHLRGEQVGDAKLGDDAHQHCLHAERIGVGQLGEVARAHHDLDFRQPPPQLAVASDRVGEAEMDRVENGVGQVGAAFLLHLLDRAQQRAQAARPGGNQHRSGADLVRDPQGLGFQAQQKIGAGLAPAQQLVLVHRVHADPIAGGVQRAHCLFQVRKRRLRQAAQVYHVGAGLRSRRAHAARIASMSRSGASTISAKMRTSCRLRSSGAP